MNEYIINDIIKFIKNKYVIFDKLNKLQIEYCNGIIDLPKKLKILDIKFSNLEIKNIPFPSSLKILNLLDVPISKIENLPNNLRKLRIEYSFEISKIENLPSSLIELEIVDSYISKIENIPKNIKILKLIYCDIYNIDNIKDLNKLKELDLSKSKVSNIKPDTFPNSLEILNLSGTKISCIENVFPKNLKQLNLSGTNVSYIENIPDKLEILILSYPKLNNFSRKNLKIIYI